MQKTFLRDVRCRRGKGLLNDRNALFRDARRCGTAAWHAVNMCSRDEFSSDERTRRFVRRFGNFSEEMSNGLYGGIYES
jgi:hypothetical protein